MQAEPAKAEEPKKEEDTAQPVPVPTTGASATEPLVTVSARPCNTVLSKGRPQGSYYASRSVGRVSCRVPTCKTGLQEMACGHSRHES